MSLMSDFRQFVTRGNLVDLAVGFTVGAAFSTLAKSLVNDVIMPVAGLLLGNVDFKDFFVVLRAGSKGAPYATIDQAQADGAVTLNYGVFVNNVIALLLVGAAMFALVRFVKRVQDSLVDDDGANDHAPSEPDDKKCKFCRTTIPYRATRCPNCTSDLGAGAEGLSDPGLAPL